MFGRTGEDRAVRFLKACGCRILDRNVRCKTGEIDIVAMDGSTLSFVEVKSRAEGASVSPWEAVTPQKQKKIRRTAEWYLLRKRPVYEACRFDVVSVVRKPDGRYVIERLKNCF